MAIDGAPPAHPEAVAVALVGPLRVLGRATQIVASHDFLLPASQRFEGGRTSPDGYYLNWFDTESLRREVLEPTEPGGSGRVLPTRWNAETDRATRAGYVTLPPRGVVFLCGPFLLGGPLPVDLSVHLWLTPAALARHTPTDQAWTLPAYERYAAEVAPQTWADLVVRMDDTRHLAIVERW